MLSKIKKIIFIVFLGYPLYFFALLFPRKKKRWVFGSGNSFSDNAKYLFLDVIENHKDIDAVWVSKNKSIVKSLQEKKLPVYYIYSFKGINYLLSANIYCLANYPSITKDISLPMWTMGQANYVQLWHGVGVKKVLFARDNDLTTNRIKHPIKKYFWLPIVYNNLLQPDIFLSTSKAMTKHFRRCFRLQGNVVSSDYPRCTIFNALKYNRYIENYADKYTLNVLSKIKNYKKIFIYMPTFREENPNYLDDAGINYKSLNQAMKEIDSFFIFKLHPWSKVALPKDIIFNNILFLDSNVDIYPFLPKTDVLITDYSSIYYDYLLMPEKHTIFFDYDRDEYINERDFAFDYDEHTNGLKVKTFEELLEALKTESYLQVDKNKDHQLREFFWSLPEEKVDLIQEIKKLELK